MMPKRTNRILPIVMILLSLVSYAQEKLSLNQAIQIGLSNNFQIQLSQVDNIIAETNNNWGQAGRYPIVTINGSNPNNRLDRNNPTSFVNGILTSSSITGTINAGWTIFGGFQVNINKERLNLLQNQSRGNEQLIIQNTVQAIILAYRKVIVESERLKVLNELKQLSYDRYKYTELRKNQGASTSFDLRQFKNAYLEDSSTVILQELNLRNAKRNLNTLLAKETEYEFECIDSISVSLNKFNSDSLKQRLKINNQQLQLEYLNLELLKNSNQLSKSSLYPTLSVNLGSSSTTSTFNLEGVGSGNGSSLEYYANFTLSYTLFNGGTIKRAVKTTAMQIEKGEIQTKELELSLNNQIVSQIDLYNTRSAILAIRQEQEKQTNLNLNLALEKVKNGSISSFEYRDFQISHIKNKLNTLQSIYDLTTSEVEIQRLTGEILRNNN